jgi:hypothetical protein
MDLIICFIDDSGFEHDLVMNEIAPSQKNLKFVQAYSFDEAIKVLNGRIPGLFLLDLWGQDIEVTAPSITPREELERMASGFNTLDYVYYNLDTFSGDKANEYLKRLFSIVDSWRSLFIDACAKIGQNNKFGLYNLTRAREEYPGVPAVFYTRKALINDAVSMIKAGTNGLFIKPTGKNDPETRALTRQFAPELIDSLIKIIKANIANLTQHMEYYINSLHPSDTSIENLITCWKEFKK